MVTAELGRSLDQVPRRFGSGIEEFPSTVVYRGYCGVDGSVEVPHGLMLSFFIINHERERIHCARFSFYF